MNSSEFSPREAVEFAIRRWWMVVVFMVLGGILGGVFHFFHKPVYEANAILNVSMEFYKWNIPAAPDEIMRQQDFAFNSAEAIINSIQVKNDVLEELNAKGDKLDFITLGRKMSLERKTSIWELRVRDIDAEFATEAANVWAEKSLAALQTALDHAIKVNLLENEISSLGQGNSGITAGQPAGGANSEIDALTSELIQEKSASGGILSIMSFSLTNAATEPLKPVVYDTGTLVLGGACIGFLLSLWVVNSFKVKRRD
jgi:capsular polysaccharide biosynthesis protein